MNLNICYFS